MTYIVRKIKRRVYTPELRPELVHGLWLLKQRVGRAMTKLLDEAVTDFLLVRGIDIEQKPPRQLKLDWNDGSVSTSPRRNRRSTAGATE